MFKKIVCALIATGASLSALAGMPGNPVIPPTGTPLLAADTTGMWSLGIDGLYLQSTAPEYQYAQVNYASSPANTLKNQSVDSSYHTALGVDATYQFAASDRDVGFSFMHADFDDTDTASISGSQTISDPFGLIPTRRSRVDSIKGETDKLYNAADIVFGQVLHVGSSVDLRPFAGMRYADLNSRNNSTYYNTPQATNPIQATAEMTSHYQGLGPRAGLDARFHVGPSVSFVGTVGAALEVGYDKAQTILQTNGDLPFTQKLPQTWYVVPELDARLGIDYQHAMGVSNSFDVQAGYQVVNYFSALQEDYQDIQVDGSSVNSTVNQQDFGFHGPYLRAQLNSSVVMV